MIYYLPLTLSRLLLLQVVCSDVRHCNRRLRQASYAVMVAFGFINGVKLDSALFTLISHYSVAHVLVGITVCYHRRELELDDQAFTGRLVTIESN